MTAQEAQEYGIVDSIIKKDNRVVTPITPTL